LLIAPLLAQVVVFPIGERQQAQDPFKETSYSLSTFGWNNKRHGGFIHTYMWGRGEGGVGVALCVEHSYGFGLDQYTHLLTTTITNLCSLFNKGCVTLSPCHSH
jgi:hypothetical protein